MLFECCRNFAPRPDLSGEDSLDLSLSFSTTVKSSSPASATESWQRFFSIDNRLLLLWHRREVQMTFFAMPRARDLFQISCVMPSDQLKTLATISGSDAQSVKPNQTSELSVLCFLFFGFDEPAIRTLCF
ncbi:hypothetical protein AAC387_Pa06g1754 [Persea americana]